MNSQKVSAVVTPAKAGVQNPLNFLDSRLHGNDRKRRFSTFYDTVKLKTFLKPRLLARDGVLRSQARQILEDVEHFLQADLSVLVHIRAMMDDCRVQSRQHLEGRNRALQGHDISI